MRKTGLILVVLILGAALGWSIYRHQQTIHAVQPSSVAAGIPVTVGAAEPRDVSVTIRGVGTVQAFNMVAVKSRVDGEIVNVGFTEGQDVKAGTLLFQIDPRPFQAALAQATATKEKDEAQLTGAEADLKRYTELVPQHYLSRQAYDQQTALVAQIHAAIRADQAQIDTAALNLQYASIRSPIDGRTGARLVDPGNLVRASDNIALVTITQLKPIYVSFTVPQTQLDSIRRGYSAGPMQVLAFSQDDRQQLAAGALTFIDNQIEPTTGTVRLKATFDNSDAKLWPGEFVNARLVTSVVKGAVTVTAGAVQQGPNGPYLYVVTADGKAQVRLVEILQTESSVAVIGKGLALGERIVVEGQYRLSDGAKIEERNHIGPAAAADQGFP